MPSSLLLISFGNIEKGKSMSLTVRMWESVASVVWSPRCPRLPAATSSTPSSCRSGPRCRSPRCGLRWAVIGGERVTWPQQSPLIGPGGRPCLHEAAQRQPRLQASQRQRSQVLPKYSQESTSTCAQVSWNSSNTTAAAAATAAWRPIYQQVNAESRNTAMCVWSQSVGAKYVIYKSDCSLWIYAIMLSAWLLHMRAEWCSEPGHV